MSSKVNCTSFFPLNLQVLEKKFSMKSSSIGVNYQKITPNNINFRHITYI